MNSHPGPLRLPSLLLALPALAAAQSAPPAPPAPRFADLSAASAPATVAAPAQTVTAVADSVRQGIVYPTGTQPSLPAAVATAQAAIVREGQVARAGALANRQSGLLRLRLAQTEAERLKLIEDLRVQSGERLDGQRETARLVRDRIRQVRDNATLTRPPTP